METITITQGFANALDMKKYFDKLNNNQEGYTFYIYDGEPNPELTDNKLLIVAYYKGVAAFYVRRRGGWSPMQAFVDSYDTVCDIGDVYKKVNI